MARVTGMNGSGPERDRLTDRILSEKSLTRRKLAEIVHRCLRDCLFEPDETDVRAAAVLRDIYDCPVCTEHIAQVYVKGIMLPRSEREFGYDDTPDASEISDTVERVFDRSLRQIPKLPTGVAAVMIDSPDEAPEGALFVDVRTHERFRAEFIPSDAGTPARSGDGHGKTGSPAGDPWKNCSPVGDPWKDGSLAALRDHQGVINIPLSRLALNPHMLGNDIARPVVFMCETGTEAAIAAEYALDAGYLRVFVLRDLQENT